MVRFEGVAVRECPYVMALQITADEADATGAAGVAWPVFLPTTLEPLHRRQLLEGAMACAYLPKAVYHHDEELRIHWGNEMRFRGKLTLRLQTPAGRIYGEGQPWVEPGGTSSFGQVYQVPSGEYEIVIMPEPEEYYVKGMRVQRKLPLRIVRERYAEQPQGTRAERLRDALEHAATVKGNVFAEIAKMALGRWAKVDVDVIKRTIDDINRRADCSDFYLVGLLGMMLRFWDEPDFPGELRMPLETCVLNFRYWMDEPGEDAMCFWSENHQILFHTCAVLAGQIYPEASFTNTGETGRWHQEKGERMALSWLRKRAAGGFREWDSNTYFEEDVLALSHLADLAEDADVADMAAIVLDKLFFTMGVNSFKGAFGSTHGRSYSPFLQSARLEPTSGMARLMWGLGNFNDRILGVVSLACARNYELPPILAAIATDQPDELWHREQHAGVMEQWCDLDQGPWAINKVTYKTPDFMLSSVQDYNPGGAGYQQHIWQATLGPDAVVFVTHPPCVGEDGSHRPNFWHGNVVLPRVAQWKDVLVAVHNFAPDDWMGFTHAYFPAHDFDEHVLRDGWAFARKGDGFVAITAAQGIEQTTRGLPAYKELRSYGHQNTWLCMLGRAGVDNSFADFQDKILALDVNLEPQRVVAQTLRGQEIAFGWEGPLLVDGVEQPLAGFPNYDGPYTSVPLNAEKMDILYGEDALRLHLV